MADKHDPHWQEALRRRQVLEPLTSLSAVPAPRLAEAAERLGLSPRQVRNLLVRFRADPRTSSLLCHTGGRPAGLQRLDATREALIAEIIETYHATRQKPRKTDSYRELCHRCHQQGLRAYDPRHLLKTREGAKRARDQWGAVREHFVAERPLEGCKSIIPVLTSWSLTGCGGSPSVGRG